jgi:hypothetical protein
LLHFNLACGAYLGNASGLGELNSENSTSDNSNESNNSQHSNPNDERSNLWIDLLFLLNVENIMFINGLDFSPVSVLGKTFFGIN